MSPTPGLSALSTLSLPARTLRVARTAGCYRFQLNTHGSNGRLVYVMVLVYVLRWIINVCTWVGAVRLNKVSTKVFSSSTVKIRNSLAVQNHSQMSQGESNIPSSGGGKASTIAKTNSHSEMQRASRLNTTAESVGNTPST